MDSTSGNDGMGYGIGLDYTLKSLALDTLKCRKHAPKKSIKILKWLTFKYKERV